MKQAPAFFNAVKSTNTRKLAHNSQVNHLAQLEWNAISRKNVCSVFIIASGPIGRRVCATSLALQGQRKWENKQQVQNVFLAILETKVRKKTHASNFNFIINNDVVNVCVSNDKLQQLFTFGMDSNPHPLSYTRSTCSPQQPTIFTIPSH